MNVINVMGKSRLLEKQSYQNAHILYDYSSDRIAIREEVTIVHLITIIIVFCCGLNIELMIKFTFLDFFAKLTKIT
jgi:hypothetical protein